MRHHGASGRRPLEGEGKEESRWSIRPSPLRSPFASVRSVEHQAIASLHRLRSTWLATRTARLNTVRGLLREFAVFIPTGAQHFVPRGRALLGDAAPIPMALRATLATACEEIDELRVRMRGVERQLAALATDIRRFPSGRDFATSLGLTQKTPSSGLRRRLGAISK